jgi:hypothetical protein
VFDFLYYANFVIIEGSVVHILYTSTCPKCEERKH